MITYWLIEKQGIVVVLESGTETRDSLTKQNIKIVGEFGRRDYAQTWSEFHNGKITREQLRKRLDL